MAADQCMERALAFAIDNSAAAHGAADAQHWLVPLPSPHHHQDGTLQQLIGAGDEAEHQQLGLSVMVLLDLEARFLRGVIGDDEVLQAMSSLVDDAYRDGEFGAVPVSAAAVAAGLEKRVVHPGEGYGECCVICMEEFVAGDELGVMPCSHRHGFHECCIAEWLGRSNACPLCRHALPLPLPS